MSQERIEIGFCESVFIKELLQLNYSHLSGDLFRYIPILHVIPM